MAARPRPQKRLRIFLISKNRPQRTKKNTEAEIPCITCGTNSVKPKNQNDLEKIKTALPECITCGVVSPNPNKSKKTTNEEVFWKQYPQISAYSESSSVRSMISYAERHAYKSSRGICYRRVKEALCGAPRGNACKGSLVSKYLHGTPVFPELKSNQKQRMGQNAILSLKSEGFVNLLDSPQFNEKIKNPASAPKGAILIYQGGGNGGHIEVKTGHGSSGSYVSDFSAPESVMRNELGGRSSAHYKLVGVMIKPVEKL